MTLPISGPLTFPTFLRRAGRRRPRLHRAAYEGVLGTSLELQARVHSARDGELAERAMLDEIERLEAIFSVFRPDSELSRWQATREVDVPVSPELAEVLLSSGAWQCMTGNAFNPAVEGAARLWRAAAASGLTPRPDELARLAAASDAPLWSVDPSRGIARRITDLPVSLNAIAKGYIVDRVCEMLAGRPGVEEVMLNVGGDLRHLGERPLRVEIADPGIAADNAAPIDVVTLRGEALATSGSYRRGFRIGDRWHSHVIDPRTARPAEGVVSASVVAASAMVADVLATACSVLEPAQSVALCDSVTGAGCLLVSVDGQRSASTIWRARSRPNDGQEEGDDDRG